MVGDDLQTSPSQVVNEAEIRSIANEHIPGHRLANQAGGDLSLYDVAAAMTGPDTMVDHFRCVPEIIDLSNRLSYGPKGKRLLPSRVREPGSLEPVKHVHVPGSRDGRTTANEIEADAIVAQVIRCHADSAYADMDFGIVVTAVDEPVAVTDVNRPANYCRLASEGSDLGCPSLIPVPTELE